MNNIAAWYQKLKDPGWRKKFSLWCSWSINILYVVYNVLLLLTHRSMWFMNLAVYHGILTAVRSLLIRHSRKAFAEAEEQRVSDLKCARLCACVLLMVSVAFFGCMLMILFLERGYVYHGYLIYGVAAYTFYALISSVVSVIKHKRTGNIMLMMADLVSLSAAMVSMVSLETAMFAQFGAQTATYIKQWILSLTGLIAGGCIIAMAVYVIIDATKQIRHPEKRKNIELRQEQKGMETNKQTKETFQYSYCAKQKNEIEMIREKYLPKKEDALTKVRKMDGRVTQKATMYSLIVGILGALLMGVGMCCTLVWANLMFVPGIFIGVGGMAAMAAAYPIYGHVLQKERARIAPEILRLTEELLK